jgi:hypothetical protein
MMPPPPGLAYPAIDPQELVIGLAYGAGAEAEFFERMLLEALRGYGYELRVIRLSDFLPTLLKHHDFSRETPDGTRRLQDMGDEFRELTKAKDALAQLGAYLMATDPCAPAPRTAASPGLCDHSRGRRRSTPFARCMARASSSLACT